MKKGLVLILAGVLVFLLTACESGEHIKLTQEESDAIAQYSAYLLMKYDTRKTHKEKLLDQKELKQTYADMAAEEAEKNPAKPTPSATPTPEIEKPDKTDTTVTKPEVTPEADPTPTPEPKPKFDSLSECFDNSFEVLFTKSFVGGSYLSDLEALDVTAREGKKFVVLEFLITNDSSQKVVFDSGKFKVKYRLKTDNKSYDPITTLIANEITLFKKELAPNESTSGVLLFEIDKNDTPNTVVVSNIDISPDKIYEITINN